MRIAVATCWKYRDTWSPMFQLLNKFWPSCPYPIDILTDECSEESRFGYFNGTRTLCVYGAGKSWCAILSQYAREIKDLILVLQDDFWLTAPVNPLLISKAIAELGDQRGAMIRLYPCPGADIEYGDAHFGFIDKRKPYAVSCQATIWRSDVLFQLASRFNTPQEFEIEGSKFCEEIDAPFLALKRECPEPWPISYYCTSVVRGQFQQGALDLCAMHGIEVDTSMREVA